MNLTPEEGKLFYDLYAALLSFVNRKLEVSSEQFSDSRQVHFHTARGQGRHSGRPLRAPGTDRRVRGQRTRRSWKTDELEIVGTWKHALPGKFYVFRYLKKYTVFLTSGGSPNKAYGVLGLADPMEGSHRPLPSTVDNDRPFAVSRARSSTTDLISGYNITFGGGDEADDSTRNTNRPRKPSASLHRYLSRATKLKCTLPEKSTKPKTAVTERRQRSVGHPTRHPAQLPRRLPKN